MADVHEVLWVPDRRPGEQVVEREAQLAPRFHKPGEWSFACAHVGRALMRIGASEPKY